MVIAAVLKPISNSRPRVPLINPRQRPCQVCGKLFWHESFHRYRNSQFHKQRKTCGIACRYILMRRNNPPEWRERYRASL